MSLVSKLSGNFLGYLHVDSKLPTFRRIKDLQVQASKLMRHATRLPRDILFWKEQEELLPQGFAYRDNLELHEEDRINKLLKSTKQERLSMMYDEDDSWAKKRCDHVDYYFCGFGPHVICVNVSDGDDELPNELLYLESHLITEWSFEAPYFGDDQTTIENAMVPVVKFLQGAQRCEEVVFNYTDCNGGLCALGYTIVELKRLLTKVQKTRP